MYHPKATPTKRFYLSRRQPMNISELVQRAHATAESKGWHDDNKLMLKFFNSMREIGKTASSEDMQESVDYLEKVWQRTWKVAKIALIMCEGAEAIEAIRKGEDEGEEIADIVIRCGDYSGEERIRLEHCTVTKMDINDTRPYKHNKKL